jgi:hypothetical protein
VGSVRKGSTVGTVRSGSTVDSVRIESTVGNVREGKHSKECEEWEAQRAV